jgi:membrane protease YdiL (CAAX protease family)
MTSLLRKPSAWVPMLLSLAALALVVGFAATVGVSSRDGDEGAAARVFQVLVLAAAIGITFFALRRVPEAPQAAAPVLALQLVLVAIPIVTILVLER